MTKIRNYIGVLWGLKPNGTKTDAKQSKGSTVSIDDFLMKHSDIVTCLERGLSINQTAETTSKGRSTVKRVKAAIKSPDNFD
ncbi:hypothetical protein ACWU37_21725 (plasmid) [Photobacterium damselae subsp. damselae]